MNTRIATSLIALTGTSAFGDKPVPQTVDHGIKVVPQRIASIGADFRLTSDWYDYGTIAGTTLCSTTLSFDAFDPNSTGVPSFGEDCNPNFEGSTRWFFGSTYCNMFSTSDFYATYPGPANRVQTAWWWQCAGQTSQSCYIAIQTHRVFDKTCDGPDRTNFLGGVILAFGELACATGSYYFTDADLCVNDLELPIPNATKGAYDIVLAREYDSMSGTLTLADCAQPMLWGTDGHFDTSLDGPGTQNAIQWDDDNPVDGSHTPIDECYDYSFGLCPEPLGSMLCFYDSRDSCHGCDECVYFELPELVAGAPVTISGGGPSNEMIALAYAFAGQSGVSRRARGFCVYSELSPPAGDGFVFLTTSDGNGNFEVTVDVPVAAQGVTVHLQAFGSGTCPNECDSLIHVRTVR